MENITAKKKQDVTGIAILLFLFIYGAGFLAFLFGGVFSSALDLTGITPREHADYVTTGWKGSILGLSAKDELRQKVYERREPFWNAGAAAAANVDTAPIVAAMEEAAAKGEDNIRIPSPAVLQGDTSLVEKNAFQDGLAWTLRHTKLHTYVYASCYQWGNSPAECKLSVRF